MTSLITFNKEHQTFKAQKLLKERYDVKIIPIPIYIEVNYFNGIAPCGFGLVVDELDLEGVSIVLSKENIKIEHTFDIDDF
ncbi:DUF3343 domain-containing protein [Mycoplasmatota bacterium WC44]